MVGTTLGFVTLFSLFAALQSPIAFQKGGQGYDTLDTSIRSKSLNNNRDSASESAGISTLPTQRKSTLFDNFKRGKPKNLSASNGSKPSVSIR